MFPIKMIYQEALFKDEVVVDVYSIQHLSDVEGVLTEVMVTCWHPINKTWITAPIWCFKPVEPKTLLE